METPVTLKVAVSSTFNDKLVLLSVNVSPVASAPGASVRTIAIARTSESSLRFIVFIKSILS